MPRTRARKKESEAKHNEFDLLLMLKKKLGNELSNILSELEDRQNDIKREFKIVAKEQKLQIPLSIGNKTVNEVKNLPHNWTSTCNSSTLNSCLDLTKSIRKTRVKRSASFDDDGYLTADSTSSGGRRSRATSKITKTTRASRSLSNTNIKKKAEKSMFKTPANKKIPLNSFGTITPKMKPNTPQILLRRPQQGEIAMSMQGSPLFTGSVVSDTMANVNIPLNDGRLFTLQPQRGLRISQIPALDPEIQEQLKIIRDNLNRALAPRY